MPRIEGRAAVSHAAKTAHASTLQKVDAATTKALIKVLENTGDGDLTARKKPSAAELKGARSYDATPKDVDGYQEMVFLKSGEVALMQRGPSMPEHWQTLNPEAIARHFDADVVKLNDRGSLVAKPAGADKAPHFDVTPPEADGFQELVVLHGKSFLMRRTPSTPEQWFEVKGGWGGAR